ncbi:hypothetical protein [Aeromonas hydrophila]|uniref:hypothetical protein n=1 Tax=Aeromonas hydrophila TaxID=644 RepID=UPI0011182BEE|nr:hypothetical protein [Aeromonas hydrophila]
MLPSLLLAATLITSAYVQGQDTVEAEAKAVCQQFVEVRVGGGSLPDEIKAQPLPKRVGEWMVDGKVKGPEGPLLFACLLRQSKRWELLNFSLWAPKAIKAV